MWLLLAILALVHTCSAADTYEVTAFYGDNTTQCTDTPSELYIELNASCTIGDCTNSIVYQGSSNATYCASDYRADVQETFGNGSSGYLLMEFYNDSDCSQLQYVEASPIYSGQCFNVPQKHSTIPVYRYVTNTSNTFTVGYFNDDVCSSAEQMQAVTTSLNKCAQLQEFYSSTVNYYVVLRDDLSDLSGSGSSTSGSAGSASNVSPISSNSKGSTSSTDATSAQGSSVSTGAIVGIVAAGVALIVLVVVLVARRKRNKSDTTTFNQSQEYHHQGSLEEALRGQIGLWDDDTITAARVPRDKVQVGKLISRGAYGEVHNGVYNGSMVAIKMLPPETRKSISHVNSFLAEVKTTATMEHPSIVTFLGVAWDSLTDLCVIMEFMDGGDLRTLLDKYKSSRHPVGFDRQKTSIALNVCHALTYMHSLSPPVIHRDLKSRNILLSRDMEAKLTDFGISRQRLDSTMTAGVGTSLWMAPEVMLGEKYDEKADIFSFGVVLSELDTHTLPYANAKVHGNALILQNVAMGKLSVEFSAAGPNAVVALGRSCVAVEPRERPTAAEALYKLQVILREEVA